MTGDNQLEQEGYKYFMRPEPKEGLGPIQITYDELTDRDMRWRTGEIGMVRNAKEKKEVKIFLDPIPHIRLGKAKQLQGWYQPKTSNKGSRGRNRPCYTEAMLTEPYGGYCTVGCAFCYINSGFRGYRGSGLTTVPMHYGEQIKKQLRTLKASAAGYFSSFSDPFLPIEDYYHNTETAAREFVKQGLPIFFLSRLSYPDWAITLLQQSKYSYAQKSINCATQMDWEKLSPGALPLEDHFEEIKKLRRAGIYVSIQVNPIIAGITDHDEIEILFEKLASCGTNHVIVKFVEAGYSWAPAMVARMTQRFGDNRSAAFRELFTQNIGGQRTIEQEYRLEGHKRYQKCATKLGMTYSVCYEYRDANPGCVSIGPEFMTSEQCHGHKVPMFKRQGAAQRFKEVKECEPSGCLTCSGGCGSEIMKQADALKLKDFKDPFNA